ELRHEFESEITRRLLEEVWPAPESRVHCYISVAGRGEVSTDGIFRLLWERRPDVKTYAPRSDLAAGSIESVEYGVDTRLEMNRWKIAEPVGDKTVEPEEIDLVIVPLICFDRTGHRVGYGKGFYD